jgi:hypothetical protein
MSTSTQVRVCDVRTVEAIIKSCKFIAAGIIDTKCKVDDVAPNESNNKSR